YGRGRRARPPGARSAAAAGYARRPAPPASGQAAPADSRGAAAALSGAERGKRRAIKRAAEAALGFGGAIHGARTCGSEVPLRLERRAVLAQTAGVAAFVVQRDRRVG